MHFSTSLAAAAAALSALGALPTASARPFLLGSDPAAPAQLAFTAPSPAAEPASASAPFPDAVLEALRRLPADYRAPLAAHLAALPAPRRVRLAEGAPALTLTEGEKALLVLAGVRFIDVTDELEDPTAVALSTPARPFPTHLAHSARDLAPLFKRLDTSRMHEFLKKFTGFRTRYYRSDSGHQSQQFLLDQIRQIVTAARKDRGGITVSEFAHPWGQNSIIARFDPPAHAANTSDAVVILGAHQDSTNLLPFLGAPGADDDASGTTSILSAFTALVESGFTPSHAPVEFHWYSAEEGGLLGSQAVAQSYAQKGIKVRSMLQMDMTAYVKPGTEPTIGIIQDYVDPEFTAYLTRIVDEYAEIPSVKTECGYACSDHASWSKVGAPSAFSIESSFADSDKNIHSTRDTIDQEGYSLEHIKQFARVALALAIELGGGKSVVA